jgi:hypothetical protein
MSETIEVAGQRVPKNWLVIGGSAAGAYVVWAWWRSRQNAQPAPTPIDEELVPITDRIPAQDSNRQPGAGGAIGTVATNAEWTEKAMGGLVAANYDSDLALAVLGKLLAKEKMLDEREASIARAAKAIAGEPPENGPHPITIAPAGTAGTPPAKPGDVRVVNSTATSITLAWSPAAGATRYVIQKLGSTGRWHAAYDETGDTSYTVTQLSPNTSYNLTVMAQNANLQNSQTVAVTASTTA